MRMTAHKAYMLHIEQMKEFVMACEQKSEHSLDRLIDDVLYSSREAAYFMGRSHRSLELWRRKGIGPQVTRIHPTAAPRYLGRHIREAIENGSGGAS